MKRRKQILLVVVVCVFMAPQVAFAAWWNPFTWKLFIFNKTPKPHEQQFQNATTTPLPTAKSSATSKAGGKQKNNEQDLSTNLPKKQRVEAAQEKINQQTTASQNKKEEKKTIIATFPDGPTVEMDERGNILRFVKNAPVVQVPSIVPQTPSQPVEKISAPTPVAPSATIEIVNRVSGGNIDPQSDVIMWRSDLLVTGNKVFLKELRLRQIDSVNLNDLANFRLYIDNAPFSPALTQLDSSGYMTLVGDVKLEPGRHDLKVLGDVVAGNGRAFNFSLRRSDDIKIIDAQSDRPLITSRFQIITNGKFSINTGRVVITKSSDSPSGTVASGASGIVLARYKLEAYSEDMRGGYGFRVSFATSNNKIGSLRNVTLYADGMKVSNSLTVKEAGIEPYKEMTCPSDCTFKIKPGNNVTLEIRGDIYDNDGTNDFSNGDTVQVTLIPSSGLSVVGMNSLAQVDVSTEQLPGNVLTVTN